MITKTCISLLAVSLLLVPANPGDTVHELSGIKCVVDGQENANQLWTAEWRNGEVYLSSHHCIDRFLKDSSAFELKANHQLVLTGQFVQSACPCCGGAIDPEDAALTLPIAGFNVHFATAKCRDHIANQQSINQRAEAVYSGDVFESAFKPANNR